MAEEDKGANGKEEQKKEDGDTEYLNFESDARVVKILGDDLIKDHTTGIMELIKNGYDADAENVSVELRNIGDRDYAQIIIRDDGTGMTPKIIKGPWCRPAHGAKESAKNRLEKTKKGRLPLGEKGVGRFAAQKLGKTLTLVTRTEGAAEEITVEIDWAKFEADTSLRDVKFPFKKTIPKHFPGDQHGTLLIMKGPTSKIKKTDIAKLQSSLMRLLSPYKSANDFAVTLKCTAYPEFEDLDRGQILDNYQFKIISEIDGNGSAKHHYFEKAPDGTIKEQTDKENIWAIANPEGFSLTNPECGKITVEINAWMLAREVLDNFGIQQDQIKMLSGISIHRDGFRIIPYGDVFNDWLRIDLDRVNAPAKHYSTNQLIGSVEINQEDNKLLVDKTSREGLKENDAYEHLRLLTKAVLHKLENYSHDKRQSLKPQTKQKKKLSSTVQALEEKVSKLQEQIEKQKPSDEEQKAEKEEQQVAVAEIKAIIPEIDRQVTKLTSLPEFELGADKERNEYLHLMSLGLVTEKLVHEYEKHVDTILKNLEAMHKKRPHEGEAIGSLHIMRILANQLKAASHAKYVRKKEEPAETDVREVISACLGSLNDKIDTGKIKVEYDPEGKKLITDVPFHLLFQAVFNILHNAIFWVTRNSEISTRSITIMVDESLGSVIISNTGPPLDRTVKREEHQPWKTTKPDGHGLGMWLSSETLKPYKASIVFLNDGHQSFRKNVSVMISLNPKADV